MSDATIDGGIYHNGRTYAEHVAWIDSLNADETLILHTPVGYRYTLVEISDLKRVLQVEIPAEFRLRFLEFLDRQSAEWGAETIASIAPMCDAGAEIVREARKLGSKQALDTFAKFDVFSAFCALNPSLLEALRMRTNLRIYSRTTFDSD
jgi:hypothetical protein